MLLEKQKLQFMFLKIFLKIMRSDRGVIKCAFDLGFILFHLLQMIPPIFDITSDVHFQLWQDSLQLYLPFCLWCARFQNGCLFIYGTLNKQICELLFWFTKLWHKVERQNIATFRWNKTISKFLLGLFRQKNQTIDCSMDRRISWYNEKGMICIVKVTKQILLSWTHQVFHHLCLIHKL